MLRKYNYGLAIMRLQPLHFGHTKLIYKMCDECNNVVIAIGSAQESRTYGNPFTYREREQMFKAFPWKRFVMVMPIKDIFNLSKWADYALGVVEKKIKNKVNAYYCGAFEDGNLFVGRVPKIVIHDRHDGSHKDMSASKIRQMILNGDDEWRKFVPAMNHAMVKRVYKFRGEG